MVAPLHRKIRPGGAALSLALLLGTTNVTLAPKALAQSPKENARFRVTLRALPSDPCFSTAAFIRSVESRIAQVQLVPLDQPASVEVRLETKGPEYVARLDLQLEDGRTLTRSVSAPSCEEASEAIAFIASVALEPGEAHARVKKLESIGEEGEAKPQSVPADEELPTSTPLRAEEATRRAPSSTGGPKAKPPRRDTEEGILTLGGSGLFSVFPQAAFGPQLHFLYGDKEAGLWSPSFSLGLNHLRTTPLKTQEGDARFNLTQLRLDLCPSLAALGPLSLRPCGLASAGLLQARGYNTEQASRATRPYLSLGGELIVHLRLSQRFLVSFRGFGAAPLIVDEFELGETIVHETGLVSYGSSASLGVQLF